MASPGKSVLVLGGARSGKSSYAEKMAQSSGLQPLYLATGRAFDDEMENRIAIHRNRRGSDWQTVEEPLDLVGALTLHVAVDRFVLVDCLTLWLTNRHRVGSRCDGNVPGAWSSGRKRHISRDSFTKPSQGTASRTAAPGRDNAARVAP